MAVDLSASIYAQYKLARKRADDAARRGSMGEASEEHRRAAGLMPGQSPGEGEGPVLKTP